MRGKKLDIVVGKGNKTGFLLFCFIVFLSVFLQGVTTYAARPSVIDDAGLFSQTEKEELTKQAEKKGNTIGADLVILTLDNKISGNRENYARSYLLDNGYGYGDGRESIIFMIDMYDRQYTVFEYNNDAQNYLLTDYEGDCILNALESYMRSADYAGAAEQFLNECVYYADITLGGNYPDKEDRSINVIICFVIGLICGAVITAIMVSSRNHDEKPEARIYMKGHKLQVNGHKDVFTHTTTVKHKIETDSKKGGGSGGFSGGDSQGGHGGSRGF